MIKILDGSLTRLGAIKNTLSANRFEEINGENTLDYSATFDGRVAEFVNEDTVYELNDEYFDTAMIAKSVNDDGTVTVDVEAEHISYRLNNPLYNVDWFTEIGTPSYILGKVLEGTGFTIGTVEFTDSITYSAQEAKSRRQLLMELVAYLGGEIGFNKFEVSIFTHRGSTEIASVVKDRNIKIVSKTVNKRQKDADGNDLVSYSCTPIFIPGDSYSLGDDVVLIQSSIGLSERLRVINISYNPYDDTQTTLAFANYTNGLENALFRIETSTIAKGKSYYGARISPEMGFESIRSDMMARTVMNADTFAMQVGDGTGLWYNRLWFDPELNLYIFDGTLSANTINAIKAEIDVVVSQVIITQTLSVEKVVAADITVDELNTSDKIPNYKEENKDPDGYIHIFDARQNFIDAQYKGDLPGDEVQKIQVRDARTNQLVYWTDATMTGITFDVTEWPVWQYQYEEFVKMALYLEYNEIDNVFEPVIQMGAGNGVGNNGKFFMRKNTAGWKLSYFSTGVGDVAAGEEIQIVVDSNGPRTISPESKVAIRNIAHLAVGDALPDTLQDGDIVYQGFTASDKLEVGAAATLYVQVGGLPEPTFIRFTGTTYSVALPTDDGLEDGVELTFKNRASGTVTLTGTVDGATNYALTTGSFCTLRYNGTDWDRIG